MCRTRRRSDSCLRQMTGKIDLPFIGVSMSTASSFAQFTDKTAALIVGTKWRHTTQTEFVNIALAFHSRMKLTYVCVCVCGRVFIGEQLALQRLTVCYTIWISVRYLPGSQKSYKPHPEGKRHLERETERGKSSLIKYFCSMAEGRIYC